MGLLPTSGGDSCQIYAKEGPRLANFDVRFGSLADLWTNSNLMSAFERKADIAKLRFSALSRIVPRSFFVDLNSTRKYKAVPEPI
jgi:hypothetical protein